MEKKITGYKIDFASNTITMNYTFAAAAEQYGTPEYNLLKNILVDFPEMKKVVKAGRNVKTANKNKNLTYEHMEAYITAFTNSEELMEVFESVKQLSKAQKSPYKFVKDWFVQQFPNYKVIPTMKEGKLYVLPIQPEVKAETRVKVVNQ